MVSVLYKYDIDLLLQSSRHELPIGTTKLYKYSDSKILLTGDEEECDTIVALQVPAEKEPYITISDEHTYCDYHPEDYGMNLYDLYRALTHNLLHTGVWGV